MREKVLVIGFGVSGQASAALLLKKGFRVIAADCNPHIASSLQEVPIWQDRPDISLDEFSFAVISPGIPPNHPLLHALQQKRIETVGEIELALRFLKGEKMVGITGSNGKTTTALLTTHALNYAGIKAEAVGNVGNALSAYAAKEETGSVLVLELSSFQLERIELKPRFDAAMILNITPNHLNRHASMQEYAEAKWKIASCIREGGDLFISEQVAKEYGMEKSWKTFDHIEIAMPDAHGVRKGYPEKINIQAAFALCSVYGIGKERFLKALPSFQKPPHRIEWVAEIDQVAYYNDSKASNVEAVMHAVRLFDSSLFLIAGGVDKGSSYRPWIDCFRGKVKKIVVFGQASSKMEKELAADLVLERVDTLQDAFKIAKRETKAGDTVLFSPGCSSYDQFVNYEQRGEAFKKMVQEV